MAAMNVRRGKAASLLLFNAVLLATGARLLAHSQAERQPARKASPAAKIESGSISDGVYRNSTFGFSYKIPFGWVDRTEVMQSDSGDQTPQPEKSQVLLAVFERPPEVPRTAINSGVVIAVESASSYPGLKEPVDYFGPLEQVTTAKGFKVVNEPYEFPVGEKPVAREDFSHEAGDMTMHQSCLVVLHRGYIVSFTFISDSDDAMDELLAGLSFHSAAAAPKRQAAPVKK
jgi:hypothetical protein